jgi:2-dehydro-3-deoxygalactonokinase
MKRYITIDGGTTNTRVNLVENERIIASKKISRGAKAGIDDRDGLKTELKRAISSILSENGLTEYDIIKILASGMITSEFGLCELPHLTAPAGISELHDAMAEVSFHDISVIPFVFIRGVKVASGDLAEFDMMRGEETEMTGLLALCGGDKNAVFVLPGSHSKIINTDEHGRISSFATMLTGEMIMALSGGTILKDAVDLGVSEIIEEYLVKGYTFAKTEGLNKALFKVRILKNAFKATPAEVYNFFLGAILADEIDNILSSEAKTVIIGGNQRIKNATAALLRSVSEKNVITVSEEDVERSTAIGAIRIFEYK